jgi:predicted metal-dependent phosphoesterase TrpH
MISRPSNVPGTATAGRSLLRRGGADLHVHTTHSDGACSPCEVVVAASRVGLSALAITDHDTISALAVARPEAKHWGVELVAGVELTCEHRGRELHLLGYFIREDDPDLAAAMESLRTGRVHRFEAMAGRLRELGFPVDLEAVRRAFPRAVLGRRHLADYLARTGQVSSLRQAFVDHLGDGRPACVEKPRLDVVRAIELIGRTGGVAALAHPPHDFGESAIRGLVDEGLRAIEVDGPGCSRGLGRRLREIAGRLDLIGVAGSDFHAPDRPGRWVGSVTTDPDTLERLRGAAGGSAAPVPTGASGDPAPRSCVGTPMQSSDR